MIQIAILAHRVISGGHRSVSASLISDVDAFFDLFRMPGNRACMSGEA